MTDGFELRTEGDFITLYEKEGRNERRIVSGTVEEMFDMYAQISIIMSRISQIKDVMLQDRIRPEKRDRRFWAEADYIHCSRGQWSISICERIPQSTAYQLGRGFGWQLNSISFCDLNQAFQAWVSQEASA